MKNIFKKLFLSLFIMSIFFLTACSQKQNSIVGTWISDRDEVISFNKDGSCEIPWAHSAAWGESADSYVIKSDGTILLSSPEGHANKKIEKAENQEEAEEHDYYYYLSGNTLVINKHIYARN